MPEDNARKLARAVEVWSDAPMADYRAERRRMLRRYAGAMYGDRDARGPVEALNLLHSVLSVFLPMLWLEPRAAVRVRRNDLRPLASATGMVLDFLAREMRYGDVLRACLLDAMWGRAITVCGVTATAKGAQEPFGFLADPDRVYIRRVPEAMFVLDCSATCFDEIGYVGHRFRAPFEQAMDSGRYDKGQLERIRAARAARNREAPGESNPGSGAEDDRYLETVELMALWLPHEQAVRVLPGDTTLAEKYLRDDPYVGPECGPYNVLTFHEYPDSLLPISPMAAIYELHVLMNAITDTIAAQAQQCKSLVIVKPGQDQLANTIRDSKTGNILFGDPQHAANVEIGGVKPDLVEAVNWLNEWLNRISGNPQVLGGKESAARTLGQEQLLFASASGVVDEKRRRVVRFVGQDFRNMAWHAWNNPAVNRPLDLLMPVPGIGEVPVPWNPRDVQESDWQDFHIEIEGYSAKSASPDARYAQIQKWLVEVILPLAQLGAAQGMVIDSGEVARLTGELLDVPEAPNLFQPAEPVQAPGLTTPAGPGGAGPQGRPANALAPEIANMQGAPG